MSTKKLFYLKLKEEMSKAKSYLWQSNNNSNFI